MRSVRQKDYIAGTPANLDLFDNLPGGRIGYGDSAIFFVRRIDELTVGRQGDAFRLLTGSDGLRNLAGRDVEKTDAAAILVRNVDRLVVRRNGKVLRIGTALQRPDNFVLCDVELGNRVRAFVRRRQRAFVNPRSADRAAAQRDIKLLAVVAGMDASRALSKM